MVDVFAVNKLIESESDAARQIGWMLYNRDESLSVNELDKLTVLTARALEEEYENGR